MYSPMRTAGVGMATLRAAAGSEAEAGWVFEVRDLVEKVTSFMLDYYSLIHSLIHSRLHRWDRRNGLGIRRGSGCCSRVRWGGGSVRCGCGRGGGSARGGGRRIR